MLFLPFSTNLHVRVSFNGNPLKISKKLQDLPKNCKNTFGFLHLQDLTLTIIA